MKTTHNQTIAWKNLNNKCTSVCINILLANDVLPALQRQSFLLHLFQITDYLRKMSK